MGFFKKKRESSEIAARLRRLDKREITSLIERDPQTYREKIIGREGAFSVDNDELIISCGNQILFRHPIKEIMAGELMNHSGICLNVGEKRYVAYYTDGTLGKKK